jgi:hypothetical protein
MVATGTGTPGMAMTGGDIIGIIVEERKRLKSATIRQTVRRGSPILFFSGCNARNPQPLRRRSVRGHGLLATD